MQFRKTEVEGASRQEGAGPRQYTRAEVEEAMELEGRQEGGV